MPFYVSLCFHIISQGAGKSHVVELLGEVGFFPLDTFVRVDPDRLRRELPEMQAYLQRDPGTAGSLTHKEVRDYCTLARKKTFRAKLQYYASYMLFPLHTNSGGGKERRILIGPMVTCQGSTRSELPWGYTGSVQADSRQWTPSVRSCVTR